MNNPEKKYECDLHCHTSRSDGNDSPLELIEKAAFAGLRAVAIVDHDITPPDEWPALKDTALEKGIEVVFGYEFSCDTSADDVHIIGYELDWKSPSLVAEMEKARNSKARSYEKLCRLLKERNMDIDFEKDILRYTDSSGILSERTPDMVQKKHIFEALALKGYFSSWEKAKLFIRGEEEFNIKREKISPFSAIDLIRSGGGFSILAHPYLIDEDVESAVIKKTGRKDYILELINAGLDGLEACYTYDKTTYKGAMTNEQIKQEVTSIFGSRVRFLTGGSDYHNDAKKRRSQPPADWRSRNKLFRV